MFRKPASEAPGISDMGVIVAPADYNKVDFDDCLFHEDGERIFFLIKWKNDEYCFTNLALIHVDGDPAVSGKRTIRRYDRASQRVQWAGIETAGTLDMDVELKLAIGEVVLGSDVRKAFIDPVKDIYKALIAVGRQPVADAVARDNTVRALDAVAGMFTLGNASRGRRGRALRGAAAGVERRDAAAPPHARLLRGVRALHPRRPAAGHAAVAPVTA